MILYGERDGAGRPVFQIAMPRSPRLYAPGETMHVVTRCNNREFYFGAQESHVHWIGQTSRLILERGIFKTGLPFKRRYGVQ